MKVMLVKDRFDLSGKVRYEQMGHLTYYCNHKDSWMDQMKAWNWKRTMLKLLVWGPAITLGIWGFTFGLVFTILSLYQILFMLPNLSAFSPDQSGPIPIFYGQYSSTKTDFLLVLNSMMILLVASLTVSMVGILYFIYGYPKVTQWIKRKSEPKK